MFELPSSIARILEYYNINKNEFEAFDRFDIAQKLLPEDIKNFCKTYLKPNRCHQLNTVPLEENEKSEWIELQNSIDQYEKKLLGTKNRESKLDKQKLLSTLPTPKELEFNYEKPDIQTTLSNGLKVYIKRKDTSPEVFIGLSFKNIEYLNLFYAQQHKAALPEYAAYLIAEETEGTQDHPEKFTRQENTDFFAALGANFSADNGTASCLPCHLEKVTKKMLHILTHPTSPIEAVNRDINNSIQQIKQAQDNLDHILYTDLNLYLFEKYPWVQSDEQDIEDLKQITRQDIVDFHKQWLAPENMFLTIVGNIDPDTVLSQMETLLGSWKNDQALNIEELKSKVQVEDISNQPAKEIIKQHSDEQVTLVAARLSTHRGTDDALALNILSIYLNQKLHEIREKSGLFYYCSAYCGFGSFLTKGAVLIRTQISPEKLDLAKHEIKSVLQNFSETGISQEEFDAAKKNFRTSYAKSFTTAGDIFGDYRELISNNKTFDYHNQRLARLDELTLEYVNFVAKKYFNPDEMTFAIGGRI
jgi:zinc protease